MATFAPSLAKSSAVASPIPEVPPVMSAILSFRRIEGISPKPCRSNCTVLRGLFLGCHAAGLFPCPPTAYAVSCILSPLRGWSHVAPHAVYDLPRRTIRSPHPPPSPPP